MIDGRLKSRRRSQIPSCSRLVYASVEVNPNRNEGEKEHVGQAPITSHCIRVVSGITMEFMKYIAK